MTNSAGRRGSLPEGVDLAKCNFHDWGPSHFPTPTTRPPGLVPPTARQRLNDIQSCRRNPVNANPALVSEGIGRPALGGRANPRPSRLFLTPILLFSCYVVWETAFPCRVSLPRSLAVVCVLCGSLTRVRVTGRTVCGRARWYPKRVGCVVCFLFLLPLPSDRALSVPFMVSPLGGMGWTCVACWHLPCLMVCMYVHAHIP